ncbi:MAG: LysR substrate-binding domain-containing protein [Myxococcota bacterium]
MDRLTSMRVFVQVVEAGGFAAAGRALQLSPPAVTRAVAGLEDDLGTQLLTRTTRRVTVTESGRRYVEDCRRILAEVADAEAAAAGSFATPTGALHVTAPVTFGQRHVLPILGQFLERYPAVRARALFLDRLTNLVDEGIDVAVRIGHLPDSSMHATRVGSVRRVVVGAPEYLDRRGEPTQVDELADHSIIAVGSSPAPTVKWKFGAEGTRAETVSLTPRLRCNTIQGALQGAEAGWGLTRVLSYQVEDALEAGRLRRVLCDREPKPLPVHLVRPEGRYTSATVRAFLDHAQRGLREQLGS